MIEYFRQYEEWVTKYPGKLTQLFECPTVRKRSFSFIGFYKPFMTVYTVARDNIIYTIDAIEMFTFLPVNVIVLQMEVILQICYNQP